MRRTFLLLTMFCLSLSCVGQQAAVDLRGQVTDTSGALISGASITLVNTSTALSRTATTLETGAYAFAALPAGNYRLIVAKPGFSEKTVEPVSLNVGNTAVVNVTLTTGSTNQTVNVSTATTGINTQESYIGTTIGQESVSTLPLQSRQFANLAVLTPGVTLQ